MIRSLLSWRPSLSGSFARRPPTWPGITDRVIYAVGDIHGRFDCLMRAQDAIDTDREVHPATVPALEVYLGDFVDRGPDTRRVIDRLLERGRSTDVVLLRGNHEVLMQQYLERRIPFATWRQLGGAETLMSYGVPNIDRLSGLCDASTLARVPEAHRALLRNLQNYLVHQDYCFVHAGLRPHVKLQAQTVDDLTRIRGDFLGFRGDFGYTVVHGHTPVTSADFQPNRINIDTGAYLTSRLCVLRIDASGPNLLGPAGRR